MIPPEPPVWYAGGIATAGPVRIVYNYPVIVGGVLAIVFLMIIAWMGFVHLRSLP
jgi:hypothetical protein